MNKQIFLSNQTKPKSPRLQIRICQNFWTRFMGLMFVPSITETEGILLSYPRPSRFDSSIHMLFMQFDLAVIWIDENYMVVDKTMALRWRPYYAPTRPAAHVLETHPTRLADFSIGDHIMIEYA